MSRKHMLETDEKKTKNELQKQIKPEKQNAF